MSFSLLVAFGYVLIVRDDRSNDVSEASHLMRSDCTASPPFRLSQLR
jgi:hypothetical protein